MATSPFKFLDSYTRDDREIFFGREREVEELYYKIYESNLLILYGSSGTGKTSLVQCGLGNKFDESDWMPITVRRAENINQSLKRTLQNHAVVPFEEKQSLVQQVQSVYLDYFKPLYFFFDQFEELFIFGSEEEIDVFVDNLQQLLDTGMSCKYVFVIRGEYLEYLSRFEEKIPDFFNNRMRVERMTRKNALRVITEPCRLFHVTVSDDFPSKMLAQLENGKATVELTYLQVYLDKLYKKAMTLGDHPVFNEELLQQTGEIGDVLAGFLDEQIAKTSNPEHTLTILKSFVSDEGTKKPMSVNEATEFVNAWGQEISHDEVAHALQQLVDLRILKDKDHDEKYELRHDALAAKIFQTFSSGEKELLEVRQFLLNRFSDFQKRNQLLEEADLTYIAPYERKLFLNNELRQFLERSRRIARRKRNRRRNIVLGTGLALILVLSGFTLFSLRQRDVALKQKQIAEQQRQEAINQKELAEKSKELALNASRQAMDAKSFAELQSKIAAEQKKIAQQQANRAQEQTQFATTQQMIALQEKAFADEKNKEAQLQRQKADSAQQEAMRLRMLELSKALALKSLQPASDPQLSALLAWESFRLNEQNGGNPQDAQLYAALHETLKKLNPAAASSIVRSKGEIKSMATAGESIIALNGDGSVSTFSITDLSFTKNAPVFPATNLNTGYVSPDGRSFIAAYDNNTLLFYDERKGSLSKPLVGHRGLVRAAAFSSDGSTFVTGGRDSLVIVWSNETAQKKIHFSGRIRSLSMHADNNRVAVGCEDGGMYLVDISTDNKRLIATAAGRIQCGCFNTKKNYLAFGNSAGLINLYNTNGSPLKTIADKTSSVDLLAMNEKQPFMVTASSNKIIHVYNMDDLSSEPVTIKEVPSGINGLALSASGKILVSCADNTIRMFDAVAVHLKDELYAVINRNFTEDEWNTYIGSDVPYQKVKPN